MHVNLINLKKYICKKKRIDDFKNKQNFFSHILEKRREGPLQKRRNEMNLVQLNNQTGAMFCYF